MGLTGLALSLLGLAPASLLLGRPGLVVLAPHAAAHVVPGRGFALTAVIVIVIVAAIQELHALGLDLGGIPILTLLILPLACLQGAFHKKADTTHELFTSLLFFHIYFIVYHHMGGKTIAESTMIVTKMSIRRQKKPGFYLAICREGPGFIAKIITQVCTHGKE